MNILKSIESEIDKVLQRTCKSQQYLNGINDAMGAVQHVLESTPVITLRELTVEEANGTVGTVLAWDKNTGFHVAWFDGVCWIEHGRSVQTPDRVWELPKVEWK